jgi:2OG-Fe(II) oxygenase superfamily
MRLTRPAASRAAAEFTVGTTNEIVTTTYSREHGLNIVKLSPYSTNVTERMFYAMSTCSRLKGTDKYDACVLKAAHKDFEGKAGETEIAVRSVNRMTSRLRNYTCSDHDLQTSPPIYSTSVLDEGQSYNVDVLFDTDRAKIWTMKNFITDDECNELITNAGPNLRRATVASADGKSAVSENRKAQQARYWPTGNLTVHAHSLKKLFKRVYTITNAIGGYNLEVEGQEDFMVIQYGKDDQYTPHCDGLCDGADYRSGGRIATAILYCQTAEIGGGTTFTNADIFLKPTNGMATFFTYKGKNGKMDDGLTKHSGCPVIVGEKWITTAWMREGVSLESPEVLFDPVGNLLNNDPPEVSPVPEVASVV